MSFSSVVRDRLFVVSLAAITVALGSAACAAQEPDASDSTSDALINDEDKSAPPHMRALVRGDETPAADTACDTEAVRTGAGEGLSCGSRLGLTGESATTLYFCKRDGAGKGRVYAKYHCPARCLARAPVSGYDSDEKLTSLSADECASSPTRTKKITIGVRETTDGKSFWRLRACDGKPSQYASAEEYRRNVLEYDVNPGAPGDETWRPASEPQETHSFGTNPGRKFLVRRMISGSWTTDSYDALLPWSVNLAVNGRATNEYLHASGACSGSCPAARKGSDGKLYGGSHGCINESFFDARALFLWMPGDYGVSVDINERKLAADGTCAYE